jgi:hypothetical protein
MAALSTIFLLASNAVPLYGVLVLHWQIFPLVLIYWLENVVVGGYNVLRLAVADPASAWRWAGKLIVIPIFVVHFGVFTFIHGVFVFILFAGPRYHDSIPPTPAVVLQAIRETGIWFALLSVVISHGVTFVWNFLLGGEYKNVPLWHLVRQPYARVLVLHIVVFLTALALSRGHTPLYGLVLLVGLKTAADLMSHQAERKRFAIHPS